jgi:hypothetical protein
MQRDSKHRLKIDMDLLIDAFDSSGYEREHFLDLKTGELLLVMPEIMDKIDEDIYERMDSEPGRYKRVPSIDTHESYQDMVDFVETVTDDRLRELLSVALNGKGAFRRFKDVLLSFPREREQWFSFKHQRMSERVYEWLEDLIRSFGE